MPLPIKHSSHLADINNNMADINKLNKWIDLAKHEANILICARVEREIRQEAERLSRFQGAVKYLNDLRPELQALYDVLNNHPAEPVRYTWDEPRTCGPLSTNAEMWLTRINGKNGINLTCSTGKNEGGVPCYYGAGEAALLLETTDPNVVLQVHAKFIGRRLALMESEKPDTFIP